MKEGGREGDGRKEERKREGGTLMKRGKELAFI